MWIGEECEGTGGRVGEGVEWMGGSGGAEWVGERER